MPANIESAVEIEPESFAASSVPEKFGNTDGEAEQKGGDAAQADSKSSEKTAQDTAKSDTYKDDTASEKEAKEKGKTTEEKPPADEFANPNLKEAKKEEAAEDDKKPAGMTDKAWVSWKAKGAEVKAAKQEAATEKAERLEIEAKYNESKKFADELGLTKKELESIKQKLADYEGEVYVSRVESHPKFKAEIKGPMDEITTGITDLAKRYEVPPDALLRAIQEPDAAKRADLLEEATADFKRVDQSDVVQSAKDWHRLQRKADDMRKDAGQKLKEMGDAEKAQSEKQTAKITQDYRDSVKDQWNAAQNTIPYIRKADGADAWNKHLDGIQREIESLDVGALPVERVSEMAISHKVLPEVMKVAKYFESDNKELRKQLEAEKARNKQYLATAPGAGGGSTRHESGSNGNGSDGDESFTGAAFASRA